jgi:hypothetical protein
MRLLYCIFVPDATAHPETLTNEATVRVLVRLGYA